MNENIQKLLRKKGSIPLIVILLVIVGMVCYTIFGNAFKAGDNHSNDIRVTPSPTSKAQGTTISGNKNPTATRSTASTSPTASTKASTKASATGSTAATRATRATTATAATAPSRTQSATEYIPFATAVPAASPADYNEQWEAGYLVAIDNPDTSYSCPHVELTDEDRDLLERLCMGEFGDGGFIGAALIAQAVKNAMCFDGYATVEDVIKYCRYDGDTNRGTNADCRIAVRYVFDHDGDAVQHRIMYMYNPYLVQSSFHESQNYILSYENVRFFDRWGY